MKTLRYGMYVLVPALTVGLVSLGGCGGKDTPKSGGDGKTGGGAAKKGSVEAKVDGYATALKGTVTFNGPADAMKVKKIKPEKDIDKCPMEVNAEGWYVKDPAKKGILYAVVYLKAPSGIRMPKYDEATMKPANTVFELRQKRCQFEPRVIVLHPAQGLKVFNDSEPAIVHDANLGGPATVTRTMPPGTDYTFQLEPSSVDPYKLSCGIHTGTMSGYVWKFEHPWAAVTDDNGAFEIKNVPVLEGNALDVWVWHEMLPDNKMKKVGAVTAKKGETGTLDFTIPNSVGAKQATRPNRARSAAE